MVDLEEQASDAIREFAIANGRPTREPLVHREGPVVGIEIEHDRTAGDTRLFVRELPVLELQLPASSLVATDPDAPGRIESLRLFGVHRILQHDEHDRYQGICCIVA